MKPNTWGVCLVLGLGLSGNAGADVISAVDRGWYRATGNHEVANQNTLTGQCCSGGEYRSYFLFDLGSLSAPIASATFRIELEGYLSNDAVESATLWDLSSHHLSYLDTTNGSGNGAAIFNDLGSGSTYGSLTVATPLFTTSFTLGTRILDVNLNSSAVSNINASLGGLFAIGISLDEISTGYNEWLRFSESDEMRTHTLVTTTAVPIPAAVWLFASGLLGLTGIVRRRK